MNALAGDGHRRAARRARRRGRAAIGRTATRARRRSSELWTGPGRTIAAAGELLRRRPPARRPPRHGQRLRAPRVPPRDGDRGRRRGGVGRARRGRPVAACRVAITALAPTISRSRPEAERPIDGDRGAEALAAAPRRRARASRSATCAPRPLPRAMARRHGPRAIDGRRAPRGRGENVADPRQPRARHRSGARRCRMTRHHPARERDRLPGRASSRTATCCGVPRRRSA